MSDACRQLFIYNIGYILEVHYDFVWLSTVQVVFSMSACSYSLLSRLTH